MVLQLVDLEVVPVEHRTLIKEILDREYESIVKQNPKIENLRVHFKSNDSGEGNNKQFSIHFLVDGGGKPIVVVKDDVDWDPVVALNKGIASLEFRLDKEKNLK